MGYRLTITDKPWTYDSEKNDDYKLLYYGTKLYGYIDNDYDCPEKELKSYKYLLEIGAISKEEDEDICYFGYGFEHQNYHVTKEQFEKFIEYYMQDMEDNFYDKTWFNGLKEFKEEIKPALEYDGDKYISWG